MESTTPEYTIAEGPQGLRDVLESFRLQAEASTDFRSREHFIMYRLNAQQSLIKVDMSESPFKFWYCDLLGRPATQTVKNTIADFLWDSCGEKERYAEQTGSEQR